MFRQAPSCLKTSLRRVQTQRGIHSTTHTIRRSQRAMVLASSAAIVTGIVWHNLAETIRGDAPDTISSEAVLKAERALTTGINEDGTVTTVVWGSNKYCLIAPGDAGVESIRTPSAANWLKDVALRDLALHEKHAACVDARGDVYQWGEGFRDSASLSGAETKNSKPTLTLKGKNIVRLQLTDSRVFALSASGKVYTFSVKAAEQQLPTGVPITSSKSWWAGWIWAEQPTLDFAEITPKEALGWRERFVSIAAGRDHLLALTSTGRTFSYAINKNANTDGQLGVRKFDIPVPATSAPKSSPTRMAVELIPKAITDPFANASPFLRDSTPASSAVSDNLQHINDNCIRFSDRLFEIQALKAIKVSQIAAGGRTSYVRTDSGKAFGWGANEFGQIGLGSSVTLKTITVPTEIVLWRHTPVYLKTHCIGIAAGGDLASFVAERFEGETPSFVDLLSCGNGQWGGLGNNLFSNVQGDPVRVKNVSGLREFSEKKKALTPIIPYAISISPTGHVLMTLDTLSEAGPGAIGRDLFVWGLNHDYQLGTGKRTSLAAPTNLEKADGTRFMLTSAKASVKDLSGKMWKKNVKVEQCPVAGYRNSVIYWKIC